MYPRHDDVSLLQRYINENRLEEKGVPMTELRRLEGTDQIVLGIDGTKIIDLITQAVRENERMAIYTYTTPFAVYEKIADICKTLQSIKNCTPLFVFNGIPFPPDVNEAHTRDKTMVSVEAALLNGTDASRMCNLPQPRAMDIQKQACTRFVVGEDVESQIVNLLRSEFQGIMRAPYYAWAQLSAFHHPKIRYVSEVYGCLELLAFPGIDRVITNINTMKGTVDMVRKSSLLELLRVSAEDLGCQILIESRNRVMRTVAHKFSSLEDMRKKIIPRENCSLGSSYVQQLNEELSRVSGLSSTSLVNVKNAVVRNLAALESPVLTVSFPFCLPLPQLYDLRQRVLGDCNPFLGGPLSPVMYYMLSAGLLSPSLFAAFCQRSLVDDWPLVDSVEYRRVAETVLPLRVQTVYHLAESLHLFRYEMAWVRRYNVPHTRLSKIYPPPNTKLDSWNLSGLSIPNKIYLVDVMEFSRLSVASPPIVCQSVAETTAAILLQTLDLLGYLSHGRTGDADEMQIIEPSSFGHALKMCTVPTLSEYTVLLIELTRTGCITSDVIQMTSGDMPSRNVPRDIVLASRILSIIPLNISGPWSGPIDTELAAFSMLSRLVSRSIRHLLETMMLMMFHHKRTAVPLKAISEIQASLPFSTPVEFGSGVLIEYILMKDGCTLKDVETAFPECTYLQHDLAALFYFWDLASHVLRGLMEDEKNPELRYLVEANERMKRAKMTLSINTGVPETYY